MYYSTECLSQCETGSDLLMQFSISRKDSSIIAASVESECHLYSIKEKENGHGEDKEVKVETLSSTNSQEEEEEDGGKEGEEDQSNGSVTGDEDDADLYELSKTAAVTTDEHPKDPSQNVVQFTFDGSHVVTGGDDGCMRIWKVREEREGERDDLPLHDSFQI